MDYQARKTAEVDIHFYLNANTDRELIAFLKSMKGGRSPFIKEVLRKAMREQDLKEKVEEAKKAEIVEGK